jgi:hypothetical protein
MLYHFCLVVNWLTLPWWAPNVTQLIIVLGNLMHLHFPSEVPTRGGQCIPAKSWKDYSLSTDDLTYGNAQGRESLCITLFEFVFLTNNFITVMLEILQK